MRRLLRGVLIVGLAVTIYLVNPLALFGPHFSYDAADLRAAACGTWQLTVAGEARTVVISQAGPADVHAARASVVRTAAACGTRTLIASADACIDETEMPLILEVRTAAGGVTRVRSELRVLSTEFRTAQLEFELPDVHVLADLQPTGVAHVEAIGVHGELPATLVRTAR